MTTYNVPSQFELTDYPFQLRNEVAKYLNTRFGHFTIPQIAKALNADENKVAWVLTNLCELTTPEVIVDSIKGKAYWDSAFKLKAKSPKAFNDATIFMGRSMY
jgi:hypothetical protein